QVLCEHGRRERNERDHHQEEHVHDQELPIGPPDVLEHRVVVRPHDAEHEEAERVTQVGRPEGAERRPETAERADWLRRRGLDLEEEERDRDGEDAVAEGLEATRLGGPVFLHHAFAWTGTLGRANWSRPKPRKSVASTNVAEK